ncbi:hypothetical protein SLEP1_g40135 [Rubroshorea leprosula]|uniref:Uncharacterized protein n=1 Tax=Rubroshorea leprosula TaxID=152421 RepID=A0AAV5L2H9_9ROSI|nr:hypothetical protein SLEP1_g40135 [Rubroshorea leprosula]
MEYQNYLRKVGHEGFQIIDACQHQMQSCKYVYPRPQTYTVLQEPFGNSTTYVYQVQAKVPAGKAPVPPSKDVAFSGNGRNGGILTSDQAAKVYGGFVSKEYYW